MFHSDGYLAPSPFTKNRDTVAVFAELTIDAIGKDVDTIDVPPTVYPCLSNFELNN